MNNYASLRQKNNGTFAAVVALFLCVALSASMLFARLTAFSMADRGRIIPLTQSSALTAVTEGYLDESGTFRPVSSAALRTAPLLAVRSPGSLLLTQADGTIPGFSISDEDKVWVGQTDIEIFRLSYENGQGQITVHSNSGDKLIAPGTSNSYTFTLQNGYSMGVNYTLTMEAYFSDGETVIPVKARFVNYKGEYLVGGPDAMADVLELNSVHVSDALTASYEAPYTLEWEWPFEGDDAYDTLLGNLAEDEDITLTIVINTYAEADPESIGGNPPYTGDQTDLTGLILLLVVSAAGLVLLLILPLFRKKQEAEHE